jgi:hypothetical protein
VGYVESTGLRALVYSNTFLPDKYFCSSTSTTTSALTSTSAKSNDSSGRVKRTIECELILNPVMLRDIHTFLGYSTIDICSNIQ